MCYDTTSSSECACLSSEWRGRAFLWQTSGGGDVAFWCCTHSCALQGIRIWKSKTITRHLRPLAACSTSLITWCLLRSKPVFKSCVQPVSPPSHCLQCSAAFTGNIGFKRCTYQADGKHLVVYELLKRHVCHVHVSGSCVCLRGGGFLLYFCSSMDLLPAHVGPLSLVFQCWSDATRRRCRSFMMSWDDLPGWLDRLNTTNSSKVTHVSIWLRTRGRFACAAVTNPDELNRLRLLDDAASAGSDTLTWNVSVVGSSATWHTFEVLWKSRNMREMVLKVRASC